MNVIGGPFVRNVIAASRTSLSDEELLASVGLSPDVSPLEAAREVVAADTFYSLIERATSDGDLGLPYRYAARFDLDNLGALGLALKTAPTVRSALQRLVRYILVLSDTLEYELRTEGTESLVVLSRPGHRHGAQIANECALGAVAKVVRDITGSAASPERVTFRHPRPSSTLEHESFFGCKVEFGRERNSLVYSTSAMETRTQLGDDGLSAFLLAELDDLKRASSERSLELQVYGAVADALPDGMPRRSQIARRLGMSERTMLRRLSEHGETYRSIARRAQLDAAESLLTRSTSSLAEIAFLTGFSDQSAFSRAFKGQTGLTPMGYRTSKSSSNA